MIKSSTETVSETPPQVLASILALASAEADADAFYGSYGPSLYHYQAYPYTAPGFVVPPPLLRTFPAPSVRRVVSKSGPPAAAPAPSVIAKVGRLSEN